MALPRVILLLALSGCLPKPGLLILAHGGGPEWNALVEQSLAPVAERMPVEVAWGMADPASVHAAVDALEGRGVQRIVAVTLFVSGDSFAEGFDAIFGDLRAARAASGEGAAIARAGGGLLDTSLTGRILLDRARALSRRPASESVLVLAHGPGSDEENERWLALLERASLPLGRLGFREVRVETLREDWPEKRAAARGRIRAFVEAESSDGEVIVLPFRVAGFGPYKEVLDGLDYVADGRGFAPHRLVADWVRRQALGCLASCDWE